MTQSPCPKCNTLLDVKILQPQIVNAFSVSIIVIEHSGVMTCPGCLTKLVVQVTGLPGFGLALTPVQEPEEKKVIVFPGSSLEH